MTYRGLASTLFQALCVTALLAGCGRTKTPAEAAARPALTVELVSPTTSSWPEQIEANGSIAPWQESIIGAEVGDLRLEEVLVDVGDVVTRGQLLARFSAEAPTADLALAEASLAQMEANSALARDKAARARRLDGTGTVSQEAILQYEADETTSAAQFAAATAQVQIQRLRLLHTEVRAPDDGVISSRSATVGAVANLGTELFRLIRQRRLEWRALVPADQLARITRDQLVTLRPAGQPAISGFVRQVSPVVDSGTLNGTVYVDLFQPGSLRSGMFVSGGLLLPATPALHVPESALIFRDGYHYVMKLDSSNRVYPTKVSTGRRLGQSVEILGENITPTDRLVRSGASFLGEGDTVRIAAVKTPRVNAVASASAEGDRP